MSKSNASNPNLRTQIQLKIESGNALIESISHLTTVSGIEKLQRKIMQEIHFLSKSVKNGNVRSEHLLCTNMHHFEAVVERLLNCAGPTSVLQSFKLVDDNGLEYKKIVVDIVCYDGQKWIKVLARNPKALTQLSQGNGPYGHRTIFDQMDEYRLAAQQHPHLFKPPEIIFHFSSGVESVLVKEIKARGITLSGSVIGEADRATEVTGASGECEEVEQCCALLNLDVTTLLAYVSSLTNTSTSLADWPVYTTPLLNHQAQLDRTQPVKPLLDDLFQGKKLMCCQSAADGFHSIVRLVGGPEENERALRLMTRVEVVPDCDMPSVGRRLQVGGRIQRRSLVVFSTGHHLRATTVSANVGLVRAAQHQGVKFVVFLHPARALAEKKLVVPETQCGKQQGDSDPHVTTEQAHRRPGSRESGSGKLGHGESEM